MATATRTKRDNRKPNFQPNDKPATLALVVALLGDVLGSIEVPQNKLLSEAGNVTFNGGIRDGWKLPGTWMDTLKGLSFEVNGAALNVAASGVHQSDNGNPTVCHTGIVELGEGTSYTVQVYATFITKKGSYNLSVRAFPKGTPRSGEQVVGEVSGLTVEPRA